MSVSGTFKLINVGKMEATVTLTMTVTEWRDLRALVGSAEVRTNEYVRHHVVRTIDDLVSQAEKSFFASEDPAQSAGEGEGL